MFIENNLRKKKPEGTFTDPDKQEVKEVSFVYDFEAPITSPVVYSSTTVRKTPVSRVVTAAPAPQPIRERYTNGGFGAIR
jgi:hypothetical protein